MNPPAVDRRARRAAACLLAALAAIAAGAPAAQPKPGSFAALEATSPAAAPAYRIGREADLAAHPGWSDLEAATSKLAPVTRGAFTGAAGALIHYRLYQHRAETRGGVVVVAGRTEGLVMYQELIRDLAANGYSVYIHDHRGQGFSQRLSADTTMGHVDNFDHYVSDLAAFIAGPVRDARAGNQRPLFLLAHSMGGAVSALYLEEKQRASGIAAAALVTPMMEPWAAGNPGASLVSKLADAFCDNFSVDVAGPGKLLAEKYADGGPFDEMYAAVRAAPPGAPNDLTHSAVRFTRHWQARNDARCDGADCGSPHAKVGGLSYRWFNQSCYGSERARGMAAAKIAVPVLLLQGERDTVVKPTAQQEFCRRVNDGGSGYCIGRTVPQALHSIFIEADAYRVPSLRRVFGFFDCVRAGAPRCR